MLPELLPYVSTHKLHERNHSNIIGYQYVLPPKSVVYTGAVGDDDLAHQLRAANQKEDVESSYFVVNGENTGACAVILTGHHR